MNSRVANCLCGLLLLGIATGAKAQTAWNFFLSDAGGGSSRLTWNVTGSLATPPGAVKVSGASSLDISVSAPGILADSFQAGGTPQSLPTLDGSCFQLGQGSLYMAIVAYSAYNAPVGGNDSFGLLSQTIPGPGSGIGMGFLYRPGTEAARIPIAFSNFNPGTYQSEEPEFGTALTVNLTIGPVPEPSAFALLALSGAAAWFSVQRRRQASLG